VADLLIKRFVSSNPSPSYIQEVSTAFKTGKYEGFGSGKYGDLAASIAATLMYRDAWAPALKSDVTHGKIREPLLKVIHFMRALEVVSQKKREVELYRLYELLGQEPYSAPTVFNFYLSKFQPNSAVKRSKLYSPEAQLLVYPRVTAFLNAMYSMIELGLTYCVDGIGLPFEPFRGVPCEHLIWRMKDPNSVNSGYLTYNSTVLNGFNASGVVEYFNVLLTGGRLDSARKSSFIKSFERFNSSFSRMDAIKTVLELFVSTPEYQISSLAKSKSVQRKSHFADFSLLTNDKDYKAIIFLYLHGGMDSFNLIVPHSECGSFDFYQHYREIRTGASSDISGLLPISIPSWGTPQPCQKFGIMREMPFLQELYNSGDASFVANIGPMVEPLNAADFFSGRKKLPIALFAHEMQTQHAETVHADASSSSGILGRIRDYFSSKRQKTSSYSVYNAYSNVLEESPGVSESQIILNPFFPGGVELLDKARMSRLDLQNSVLNLTSNVSESIFADTWNEAVSSGLRKGNEIRDILISANITQDFTNRYQMEFIARAIASRSKLNSTIDTFSFRMGGFDTHDSFHIFGILMAELNVQLRFLVTELKAQGVWDKVLIVGASEFGRTLRSNGAGTDHGWGGNTFLMGGSVRGGQILGKYPSRLDDPNLHLGNGILTPTTPWEGIWNGIAQWAGVPDSALDQVLPNRKNFLNGDYLFTKDKLFKK
jgi:uncharacterized protein (DUF1501 family)